MHEFMQRSEEEEAAKPQRGRCLLWIFNDCKAFNLFSSRWRCGDDVSSQSEMKIENCDSDYGIHGTDMALWTSLIYYFIIIYVIVKLCTEKYKEISTS